MHIPNKNCNYSLNYGRFILVCDGYAPGLIIRFFPDETRRMWFARKEDMCSGYGRKTCSLAKRKADIPAVNSFPKTKAEKVKEVSYSTSSPSDEEKEDYRRYLERKREYPEYNHGGGSQEYRDLCNKDWEDPQSHY